ncbi:acyl-CoA dehydrogenase family protein [Rothia uropygioeca]|uniref:acyl-CoA dehydrogenase family protein n=1 Tax=Kocuria sp. 257 TaxID=2021970 RepID=UPI001011CEBA|nr:acyl-CoA dehydrogenase [Kocuria sp. 257]
MPLNENVSTGGNETDNLSEQRAPHKGSPEPLSQGPVEEIQAVQDPQAAGTIDVTAIQDELMGKWKDIRQYTRDIIEDPDLHKIDTDSYQDQRKRVSRQLEVLVDKGVVHRAYPKYVGGQENPGGNIAGFEELVAADPSLQIKAGVQWGLFGAAVHQLGSEEHHRKWLPDIMSLKTPGVFAMTEIGHGSDVASVGTTATFDAESGEFVINTPFKAAWKDYLGNAAQDGKAAVVFAQLITRGVNHGVHAFYVPIRDEEGYNLPGITSEDDGRKGGLNGVDNGRLAFDHVRIPRTNLLNRYGDVAEDGTYSSPIDSPGRRFFTTLGTLVQGRVSLDGSAINAAKIGLSIAIRYAYERRQFSAGGDAEATLMSYQLHRRRLLPLLATTYAQALAHHDLLETFDEVFSGRQDTPENRAELETLAAALKPMSTWNALETLQECREACGGSGFMTKNRFTSLYQDLDVYATFEGDNHVLLQLVAKRLLGDYSKEFAALDFGTITKYVSSRAEDLAVNRTGLRRAAQILQDTGDQRKSAKALKDPKLQRDLLGDRVHTLIAEAADALRPAKKMRPEEATQVFNTQQVKLIEAARSHAELLQWEAMTESLTKLEGKTAEVMTSLRDLFGMTLIEKNLGWYISYGLVSTQRGRALGEYINHLLEKIEPFSLQLVEAFGFKQAHLRAEISSGIEAVRQSDASEYFRKLRASSDAPVDEKTLNKMKRKQKTQHSSKKKR